MACRGISPSDTPRLSLSLSSSYLLPLLLLSFFSFFRFFIPFHLFTHFSFFLSFRLIGLSSGRGEGEGSVPNTSSSILRSFFFFSFSFSPLIIYIYILCPLFHFYFSSLLRDNSFDPAVKSSRVAEKCTPDAEDAPVCWPLGRHPVFWQRRTDLSVNEFLPFRPRSAIHPLLVEGRGCSLVSRLTSPRCAPKPLYTIR